MVYNSMQTQAFGKCFCPANITICKVGPHARNDRAICCNPTRGNHGNWSAHFNLFETRFNHKCSTDGQEQGSSKACSDCRCTPVPTCPPSTTPDA